MEITIKGSAKEIIEFVNEIKNENSKDESEFVKLVGLAEIFNFVEEKADHAAEPQSQPKELNCVINSSEISVSDAHDFIKENHKHREI